MNRLLRPAQADFSGEHHQKALMMLPEDVIIDIDVVEYIADYKLRISFGDGEQRMVDFETFLRNSLNPQITKYLDVELFKKFTVACGDLFWNDYDLCFPVADLYEGRV